ncbi:MAG: response regulator receiver [Elusimicrobia bacterium]|nr:MAG: response regulator receiver [Elusimicrobiota bacterium]KAF0154184.1 MAG: response regulator receiver [Elusimicrobiota bacterium]
MKILVVDDNLLAAGILKTALESQGHEAMETAQDYDAALAACRRVVPDLAFVDLVMPGRDGLELIGALRREFPSVLVAVASAVEQAGVDDRIRELGGIGILRKPFSMAELRAFMDSVTKEMKKNANIGTDAWRGLAEEAVARSIAKLARISSGKWTLKDIEVAVSAGALRPDGDQDGAGVIFTVSGPGSLRSLITFRPGDVEVISRCFLGYSFVKMSAMNKAEELLISEVGNILFNSFLSVISARTGEMLLPSVPRCIQGGLDFITGTFGESLPSAPADTAVRVTLTLSCRDGEAECSVLLVMGEELRAGLV